MEYLIRFSQSHETFRLAEIQSLAIVEGIDLNVISYSEESPFCVVRLPSEDAAKALLKRSVLAQTIHEHWGTAENYDELHAIIKRDTAHLWPQYKDVSFKINIDTYQGSRPDKRKIELINSFAYLAFEGLILLKSPDQEFTIFEQWDFDAVPRNLPDPLRIYFGRLVGRSVREVIKTYDLKKRGYISTTSMDSELALVTANIALAAPGKIFYDPFVGTGSFPIACAHFGALGFGSDIDGRSVRGEGGKKSLKGNFQQYGLEKLLGDVFVCDLTNSPVRRARTFDGIVCDPPYGVREGLRVLGCKDPEQKDAWLVEKGKQLYRNPRFVPPKKPYSFMAMLDDILNFAADTLVDNGRLSFWMPTANDEEQEIPIPAHPCLELVVVCTQVFNKWSRRLITYRRLPEAEVDMSALSQRKQEEQQNGHTADDLNAFRRAYFKGFKSEKANPDVVN
ncbi:tRNA guanosine-2'-O-methyltransferase TRM11 [Hypoxylon fragiforme]|uniref:tRNA guanosine-2'-O-methyltransferase TRM11 n=1 Tax=Hypoxylon fragiforme TaxID=63214 RepID=UPI0020C5B645|nr:tRNA guanosine-2'-O-methyltransferase TRM11 [Hypoxylon fragiforme]KAI2609338.1 tRNA guanosine-2'-O-methyltransferase TRM11 [Hypoxylon fragiforme]